MVTKMQKIKNLLNYYPIAIFFILILAGYIYIMNTFNYLDLLNSCSITINKDFLHGNRQTIQQALSYIKKTNPSSYNLICRNVQKISEDYCPITHTYGGPWQLIDEPSCFVKGTRIIYVKPSEDTSNNTILERAETIKHTANLLNEYRQQK